MTDVDFRFTIGPVIQDAYQKRIVFTHTDIDYSDMNVRDPYDPNNILYRCATRYYLNSDNDIDLAEKDSNFDLSYVKHRLFHDVRPRYSKSSIMILEIDQEKILDASSLRDTDKLKFHATFLREALSEDAYAIIIMKDPEFFQHAAARSAYPKFSPTSISSGYYAFYYNHSNLLKKSQTYRIYLNERLLVERVWDTEVDCNRFCYEETISLNNIPKDGYNFKLVTSLNLGFVTALVNGVRHPITGKSFSLES